MIKTPEEYLDLVNEQINFQYGKEGLGYLLLKDTIKQAQIDIAKDVWQAALTASEHDVKHCKYNNIPATIEDYLKMKGLENENK